MLFCRRIDTDADADTDTHSNVSLTFLLRASSECCSAFYCNHNADVDWIERERVHNNSMLPSNEFVVSSILLFNWQHISHRLIFTHTQANIHTHKKPQQKPNNLHFDLTSKCWRMIAFLILHTSTTKDCRKI